jgi:DNA-binding transcriptional MerR regulator
VTQVKIGQVAAEAGVSVDTVRFYERRGVLPTPQRRPSGYREYEPSTVERIRVTRDLQQLGLSLDEVIAALHDHDAGNTDRDEQLARLEAVIERIDTKITDLRNTRRTIRDAIDACRSGNCRFSPTHRC